MEPKNSSTRNSEQDRTHRHPNNHSDPDNLSARFHQACRLIYRTWRGRTFHCLRCLTHVHLIETQWRTDGMQVSAGGNAGPCNAWNGHGRNCHDWRRDQFDQHDCQFWQGFATIRVAASRSLFRNLSPKLSESLINRPRKVNRPAPFGPRFRLSKKERDQTSFVGKKNEKNAIRRRLS